MPYRSGISTGSGKTVEIAALSQPLMAPAGVIKYMIVRIFTPIRMDGCLGYSWIRILPMRLISDIPNSGISSLTIKVNVSGMRPGIYLIRLHLKNAPAISSKLVIK